MDKQVNVIIHGHFYQPPREDPWINYIENQTSANPYKNWNDRITAECYGPNAYSRVLDRDGRIKDIINNYKYISFNFGATLLNYLEKKERLIYDLIIEADKYSIEKHNGHGNAIAQIYNHVIMPLQSDEDKKTEIIWGLKDFEKRFGRISEGMWLSETAVDYKTIDLLIDYGIKYIILSPLQAELYKKSGDEKWTKAHEKPINTNHPYKIIRDHGQIAVFYYDKLLSTAVSFEHLLHSADNLAARIIHHTGITSGSDVVVIASDGEIYGHHEPFADMCLATLISSYHEKQNKIKFMNFGEYLSINPVEYETKIWLGDDGLGSSWSCFHGVGRWYKNCGCHTGGKSGWNQKWRTPLRDAFDLIKKGVDEIYYNETSDLINSPVELRNDYIEFILSDYDINKIDFIKKYQKKNLSSEEITRILILLESQKYALFMYTSCGWFFTEISGIETIQNIKYAYKSLFLLGEKADGIRLEFEKKLEETQSNIHELKNGLNLLKNWIYPHIHDYSHIANNFIALLKTKTEVFSNEFEFADYFSYSNFSIQKNDNFYSGKITIFDKIINCSKSFDFLIEDLSDTNYSISLNSFNENHKLSQKELLPEVKKFILNTKHSQKIEEILICSTKSIDLLKDIGFQYKNMDVDPPEIFKSITKTAIETQFHEFIKTCNDFPEEKTYLELLNLFELSQIFSINLETRPLKNIFSKLLFQKLSKEISSNSIVCRKSILLIDFCNKTGLILEKSQCENIVFNILKNEIPVFIKKINETKSEDEKAKIVLDIRNLIVLSEIFNINTDDEKKMFFKHIGFF